MVRLAQLYRAVAIAELFVRGGLFRRLLVVTTAERLEHPVFVVIGLAAVLGHDELGRNEFAGVRCLLLLFVRVVRAQDALLGLHGFLLRHGLRQFHLLLLLDVLL